MPKIYDLIKDRGVPEGGSEGQVLIKEAGEAKWKTFEAGSSLAIKQNGVIKTNEAKELDFTGVDISGADGKLNIEVLQNLKVYSNVATLLSENPADSSKIYYCISEKSLYTYSNGLYNDIGETSSSGVKQIIKVAAAPGHIIEILTDDVDIKRITQVMRLLEPQLNETIILKPNYNNTVADNFLYDSEFVEFDGRMKLKTSDKNVNFTLEELHTYESELIEGTGDLIDIKFI